MNEIDIKHILENLNKYSSTQLKEYIKRLAQELILEKSRLREERAKK